MAEPITSSGQSATPTPDPQPATGNASAGATPTKPTVTLEEALAQLEESKRAYAELEHSHKNTAGELKRHRERLDKIDQAEEQAKIAALSDVEKATKRATDAEQRAQQLQTQLVHAEVKMAAQAKGIIDPDLAALAIKDKLEYGDDGMPSNLDKVLDALVKSKPFLVPKAAEPPAPSEPPVTPATSAAVAPTPALPAMNPGRTSIQSPGAAQPGKIPSWDQVYKRQ